MKEQRNKYRISYMYISTKSEIGTIKMFAIVEADSFGDAEALFDMIFRHVNDIADNIYCDDAVYEITGIEKVCDNTEK